MGRDRYLDALRAAAIVRVVTYHAFPVAALSYLPAMGVMFALGGSLMARSLDKAGPRTVLPNRLRRLLPAMWLLGLLLVPAMIAKGWQPDHWAHLLLWVLPVADPPGSDWGEPAWGGLWYLKTYLWFVLLSPLLLPAFRRVPWLVLLVPPVALYLAETVSMPDAVGSALNDGATFLACWLLGFAHHDGWLRRMRPWLVGLLAALAIGGGVAWLVVTRAPADLDLTPPAMALYSVGTVFVLLRFSPSMGWLAAIRPLDRLVTVVNARAVTIYLWHNVAITVALWIGDRLELWSGWEWFPIAWLLVGVAVLAFGWVEDVAARRRPQLWPGRQRAASTSDVRTEPADGGRHRATESASERVRAVGVARPPLPQPRVPATEQHQPHS